MAILGLLTFLTVALALALFLHRIMVSYWLTSIISAVLSTAFFEAFGYVINGFYTNPFLFLTLITESIVALVIALAVGRHKLRKER